MQTVCVVGYAHKTTLRESRTTPTSSQNEFHSLAKTRERVIGINHKNLILRNVLQFCKWTRTRSHAHSARTSLNPSCNGTPAPIQSDQETLVLVSWLQYHVTYCCEFADIQKSWCGIVKKDASNSRLNENPFIDTMFHCVTYFALDLETELPLNPAQKGR
ncbi:hypothetical protein VTO42DRAFT_651 [Malbranchea cinnamomea]